MKKTRKRQLKAQEVAELRCEYQLSEAVELLGKMPKVEFDETVVLSMHSATALAAGADEAGLDDILKNITDGWLEFGAAVATTEAKKEIHSVARIFGGRVV